MLLVVENDPVAGAGRLGPLLGPADVRRPHRGDRLPAGPQGYAGVVVLGGEMAAWEDDVAPWLPATRALMADTVRAGVPLLGICLGAQLLALACGGRVERGDAGPEFGLTPVRALPGAAGDGFVATVLDGAGPVPEEPFAVAQYHRDVVTALPADADLLVTGDRYPHQAFRVGTAAWATQYHPEVTVADFAAWCRTGGDDLRRHGIDPAAAADRVAAEDDRLERLARAHADGFRAMIDGAAPPKGAATTVGL